jgi:hypothetical protein
MIVESNGGIKEGGWDGKESMDLNKEKGVLGSIWKEM